MEEPREDYAKRYGRGRLRFRGLVRFVMLNLSWLSCFEGDAVGNLKKVVQLATKTKKKELIGPEIKTILCTASQYRTPEEIKLVTVNLLKLKCFKKFDYDIVQKIAEYGHFICITEQRIVIREGAKPWYIYFVLKGDLEVTGAHIVTKASLSSGDEFGYVALMQNTFRDATVKTIKTCDLLYLETDHFNLYLKPTMNITWERVWNILLSLPQFITYKQSIIRQCCIISRLKVFPKFTTILGDNMGTENWAHFVVSGKCSLIEHFQEKTIQKSSICKMSNSKQIKNVSNVTIDSTKKTVMPLHLRTIKSDKKSLIDFQYPRASTDTIVIDNFRLTSKSEKKLQDLNKISRLESEIIRALVLKPEKIVEGHVEENFENAKTHFMQIGEYTRGACFGIGENMERRRIVAKTDVECLMVPNYFLLPLDNHWRSTAEYLNKHIPSSDIIYKTFLNNRRWKKYTESLMKSYPSKLTNNDFSNVPFTIRINSEQLH